MRAMLISCAALGMALSATDVASAGAGDPATVLTIERFASTMSYVEIVAVDSDLDSDTCEDLDPAPNRYSNCGLDVAAEVIAGELGEGESLANSFYQTAVVQNEAGVNLRLFGLVGGTLFVDDPGFSSFSELVGASDSRTTIRANQFFNLTVSYILL